MVVAEVTPTEGIYKAYFPNDTATLRMVCWVIWFDLIVLFYMDSLNKTRSLLYIKVHEATKALIKDIGPVNRVHLTVLVSIEKIYILGIG